MIDDQDGVRAWLLPSDCGAVNRLALVLTIARCEGRMRVVAYVAKDRSAKLVSAMHSVAEVLSVCSWPLTLAKSMSTAPDVIVLDPVINAFQRNARVLLYDRPDVGIVFYTEFTPDAIRSALSVASAAECDIIFDRIDDSPINIRRIIGQSSECRHDALLAKLMHDRLCTLPSGLTTAFQVLFRHPEQFANTRAIAHAAHVSTTLMYNECLLHSLPSPKSLVIAARIARGYLLLHGSKVTVEETAHRIGYHQAKVFSRHTHHVLGVPPSSLRSGWDRTQFSERLVRWLLSRQPGELRVGTALGLAHTDAY